MSTLVLILVAVAAVLFIGWKATRSTAPKTPMINTGVPSPKAEGSAPPKDNRPADKPTYKDQI